MASLKEQQEIRARTALEEQRERQKSGLAKEQLDNARNTLLSQTIDGFTGSVKPDNAPAPNQTVFDGEGTKAPQANMGGLVNLFTGKPKIEDKTTYQGLGDTIDKAVGFAPKEKPTLLSSKESTKTVGKTQNQMERPTPKPQAKPSEEPENYVLDPKKMDKEVKETKSEIVKAGDDKSMWDKALSKLGFAKEIGEKTWDELGSASDRVDWLTTLTVYAASRYMGNNGGLALANGLMRGMESRSKQKQLEQAVIAGQQKAEADAEQRNTENDLEERRVAATEANAVSNRMKAQGSGNNLLQQLTSEDSKVIDNYVTGQELPPESRPVVDQAAQELKAEGKLVGPIEIGNKIQQMLKDGRIKQEGWFTKTPALI